MMPNKIILLTIFLYITLNLRKIENFIQTEDDAAAAAAAEAEKEEKKEKKKEKEERKTIQEIKTNEMEETKTRAVYSILYLVGILVIIYLLGRDDVDVKSLKFLRFFDYNSGTGIWVMTFILFIILVSVTIAAFNAEDMDSEEWKALIWIESLTSEIISVLTIYVVVKIVASESEEYKAAANNDVLIDLGGKILKLLAQLDPGEGQAADKA